MRGATVPDTPPRGKRRSTPARAEKVPRTMAGKPARFDRAVKLGLRRAEREVEHPGFPVEMWPVDKPIDYPKNPRKWSAQAVAKVGASIREFGFRQPIVVDRDGVIIIGHLRRAAAKMEGLTEVPVHVAAELSPERVKALRLADNRVGQEAEWELEALAGELLELNDLDFDVLLTGFDQFEISQMLTTSEHDESEDQVPDVPVCPTSRLGDIWLCGSHRVLCGDSTSVDAVERLMDGEKAEMMFTDPPYGVNYEGGHFHSEDVNIRRRRRSLASDDCPAIYTDALPVLLAVVDGPCYVWFAHSKGFEVFSALHQNQCEVSAVLIWHKTNATYAAMNAQYKQRHEPCLYFKPKGSTLRWIGAADESTLWEEKRDSVNDLHPTQKPVCLAERAIRNHSAKTVFDPFLGSGSTIIACEKTERICYGLELAPEYVDVIVERWQKFTGKQATLAGDGTTFEHVKFLRKLKGQDDIAEEVLSSQ